MADLRPIIPDYKKKLEEERNTLASVSDLLERLQEFSKIADPDSFYRYKEKNLLTEFIDALSADKSRRENEIEVIKKNMAAT